MRFLRRSLTGLFLLAVTLAALTVAGQLVFDAVESRLAQEDRPRFARERVFAANVLTVQSQSVIPTQTTFGEVRSRRSLDLRAKASGTVVTLHPDFEEGGAIAKGELLFAVDPADAEAAVALAEAEQAEAAAELNDAERALKLAEADLDSTREQADLRAKALERQKSLLESGFGSNALVEEAELSASSARQSIVSRQQLLAQAESRVDLARSQLVRAGINLDEAKRRLSDTRVFAEFDGTLADVTLVEGGLVATNEQVARLIDADDLEVSFRISTPQYTRLLDADGRLTAQNISISLDSFGAELTANGRITRESVSVSEGQTGRLLYARLADARGFRPGDFVTVKVEEPALSNVAVLPATAVDAAGTVLVVGEEDRLSLHPAPVLRRQGDNVIVPADDLNGRVIVAERSPLLGEGIKIKPVNPGAPPAAAEAEPEMVELTPERRARLIAFVENNQFMPKEAKERVLAQLAKESVPANMIARIESRMGG